MIAKKFGPDSAHLRIEGPSGQLDPSTLVRVHIVRGPPRSYWSDTVHLSGRELGELAVWCARYVHGPLDGLTDAEIVASLAGPESDREPPSTAAALDRLARAVERIARTMEG